MSGSVVLKEIELSDTDGVLDVVVSVAFAVELRVALSSVELSVVVSGGELSVTMSTAELLGMSSELMSNAVLSLWLLVAS